MHIRKAALDDLGALARLIETLGYSVSSSPLAARLEDALSRQDHFVFVAEVEGEVVGFCHGFKHLKLQSEVSARVESIAVDQSHRRTGAGSCLMAEVETWARDRGLNCITLSSSTDRATAPKFYARLGFSTEASAKLFAKNV